MDQFVGFLLALLAFALFIFMISRAVKYVIVLGFAIIVYFVLTALGILG